MAHARSDDLWFLAPGLMHHLGNAVFAARGQLQLAALDTERAAPALQALLRAQTALGIVRHLLPGGGGPVALGACVHGLAEMLRVPLRDLGLRLVTADVPAGAVVDAAALLPAILGAVRGLANAVPQGLGAVLTLTATTDATTLALRWGLEPGPGLLPFGLDWTKLAATVRQCLPMGVELETTATADGLLMVLPTETGAETADSDANLR
ncbi:MAG: hypothetical protein IPK26_25580 [Planctomycetes bacterium]|nr:hypothetical protein [Planctomycetota bacterium]